MNAPTPIVCSCFGGFVFDDCDRMTQCTRCRPAKPVEFHDFREYQRAPSTEGDLDVAGRTLRPGT